MGPKARYLGSEVLKENLLWQDPLPAAIHQLTADDITHLKAQQLTLNASELTVLLGGLSVLGTNFDGSARGVFTDRPGVLSCLQAAIVKAVK